MSEASPLLEEKAMVPEASFTFAHSTNGRKLPQAIAHRGYKAVYPENTMSAFKGAVEIGAHALETDVHLSKDGVVVLSHDATLQRCFGKEEKIMNCEWSYLESLETLKEPRQRMPRLIDLLEYMASPGLEKLWVLLDIKLDDDPEVLMRSIASTIAMVPPSRPWNERIVLGCWTGQYISLALDFLPGFPITHIGISLTYARQFLSVPNISFNILQKVLHGPCGRRFLRDAHAKKRAVYVWTVNDVDDMYWSIQREVDGVITDDPKTYLEVCDHYDGVNTPRRSWKSVFMILFWNVLVRFFFAYFKFKHRAKLEFDLKALRRRSKGALLTP